VPEPLFYLIGFRFYSGKETGTLRTSPIKAVNKLSIVKNTTALLRFPVISFL
jgi:hypothetical protein